MTGTVDLSSLTALTYGGVGADLTAPYGAPYGTCTTTDCHQDGRGTTVTTEVWGAGTNPVAGCDYCHATPPNPAGAANEAARHATHIAAATAYVADSCGTCHTANANQTSMNGQPTHMDGTVDVGGTATVDYAASPQCTNDCHLVDGTGTWTDANGLACTECHDGTTTYIGPDPVSGLHIVTTAEAHDVSFPDASPSYTCSDASGCHAGPDPSGTDHIDGVLEDAATVTYSWSANVGDYDDTNFLPDTGCQASCHADGGDWWRVWTGVVDDKPDTFNPGDAVCNNCHGDFASGFNWDDPPTDGTTVDHTDPSAVNTGDKMDQHAVCQTCHGWGHANYNETWLGSSDINYAGHGDGHITMNGPDEPIGPFSPQGAQYDDDTGGCAKACHSVALVLNNSSGWTANYGDFGAGDCEGCHGNPPHAGQDGTPGNGDDAPNVMGDSVDPVGTNKPYDDGQWGYYVNGHGADGTATWTPAGLNPDQECSGCHDISDPPSGAGAHFNGILNSAEQGLNPSTNTAHLLSSYLDSGPTNDYDPQLAFDSACYTLCHQGSGVTDMRHTLSNPVTNVMEFGRMSTTTDGESIAWPIDVDVSSYANSGIPPGDVDYGLCVSCHNPHGTSVDEPTKSTNRMVREHWVTSPSLFCGVCHF
jgi:predicted CxxxxCH...CXXCH cytochrome family protein